MRIWPRSIFGRLLAVAGLAILAALLFASVAIGHVLERFVMRGLDDRLDAQVELLARAVRPDGTLDPARAVSLADFAEPGSGWIWQVDGPKGGQWRSSAAPEAVILLPRGPQRRGDRGPRPGEGRDALGRMLHSRSFTLDTPAGPVAISARGPRRIVEGPLREAMVPLLVSLLLLGLGLAAATLLQLRIGLRPLRALRDELARVRSGAIARVSSEQPVELAPLVAEVNALLAENEAGLASARRHVANLAHGMKTPLATLALKLSESGRDPDGSLGEMVDSIDRRVRHHLGRARAAAPGGARVRTLLAPAVADLVQALRRIHADRGIEATVAVAPDLVVAIDPQDLDELIGNLLDNGWRHARSSLRISAQAEDSGLAITVEDDGMGMDDESIALALLPGRRLDESGDGHGFGLSIARELVELNGGSLHLDRSPALGGLRVGIRLPMR
ncbi:sensor histidine kinase [Sphingomonas sp. M1-B02]|uniref:sensor histidine kinase n=1 Tax=Sphingomonas sp. M1-B02 TaxID=3114300 RepID=UPI00223F51B5|nr:HAMP domain-containing sensor histidine kinase [Sphingomonas sp. S6-11]UZK65142.1 HAMP domain-containing histidine kinase [Sphingomonas sp. S6-11]